MVSSIGGFLSPHSYLLQQSFRKNSFLATNSSPLNLLFKKPSFNIEKGNSGNPEKQLIMILLNLYIFSQRVLTHFYRK